MVTTEKKPKQNKNKQPKTQTPLHMIKSLSKTHMHSWSSVKSDTVTCPKVLAVCYLYKKKKNINISDLLLNRNLTFMEKNKEFKSIFWN